MVIFMISRSHKVTLFIKLVIFKTYFSASAHSELSSSLVLGNVFYKQGIIVMTSTGSKYLNAFTGNGTDGYRLEYRNDKNIVPI